MNEIIKIFPAITPLNAFLFDMTTFVIGFIDESRMDYRVFARSHTFIQTDNKDNVADKIYQITNEFINELQAFEEYIDCDCHCDERKERCQKINEGLKIYMQQMIALWDSAGFEQMLMNSNLGFMDEYRQTLKSISNRTVKLADVEKSLLYWKDAVSDLLLQNVLLSLRYTYIAQHLNLACV